MEQKQQLDQSTILHKLTPQIPLDLTQARAENNFKYRKQTFRHILLKEITYFPICKGLTLKDSLLQKLPPKALQNITIFELQNTQPQGVIFPEAQNQEMTSSQGKQMQSSTKLVNKYKLGSLKEKTGIYRQVIGFIELPLGLSEIGMPPGQNHLIINYKGGPLVSFTHLESNKKMDLDFSKDQKVGIQFVKMIPKKPEEGDDKLHFFELIATADVSRRHSLLAYQKGKIILYDGTLKKNESMNGTWIKVECEEYNEKFIYCYSDFRIRLTVEKEIDQGKVQTK